MASTSSVASARITEPGQLDLARLASTSLVATPFPHIVLPGFIRADALEAVLADFPQIDQDGSHPMAGLVCGSTFTSLVRELQSQETTSVIGAKFGLDLSEHPTVVTLRGQSGSKDGRIHIDSRRKLVTALIYMNDGWEAEGGRLRLLRGPDNIEDYAAEVSPLAATLLIFRCCGNAWHGYKRFVGPRRSIQVNWMTDERAIKRKLSRNGSTAFFKRFSRFLQRT